MLALTVFSRVPLEESVLLGLVGFIGEMNGSDRLTLEAFDNIHQI